MGWQRIEPRRGDSARLSVEGRDRKVLQNVWVHVIHVKHLNLAVTNRHFMHHQTNFNHLGSACRMIVNRFHVLLH